MSGHQAFHKHSEHSEQTYFGSSKIQFVLILLFSITFLMLASGLYKNIKKMLEVFFFFFCVNKNENLPFSSSHVVHDFQCLFFTIFWSHGTMRIEHITEAAGGERKKEGKQQQKQECLKGVNLSISEIRYFGRFNLFGRSMSSSASFPPFAKVFLPRERWEPSIFRNGPQSSCNVINTQNCGSRETSIKWVAWWRFTSFPRPHPYTIDIPPRADEQFLKCEIQHNSTANFKSLKRLHYIEYSIGWLRFVHFEILLLLSKLLNWNENQNE